MTNALTKGWPTTALVALLALTGCGGGGGNDGGNANAGAGAGGGAGGGSGNATGIATLGPKFVAAFNQDNNDEPLPCEPSDLTVTPSIEPFLI